MSRALILQQYIAVKESLSLQIQAIKSLVKQCESLTAIAQNLSNKPEEKETKEAIETQIKAMENTIVNMADNVDELFESYQKYLAKLMD